MNLVVHATSALFPMRAAEGSHHSVEEEVEVVKDEEAAVSFCPRPQNTDNECSSHWKISAPIGPGKKRAVRIMPLPLLARRCLGLSESVS